MLTLLRRIAGQNADVVLVAVTVGILIVLFTPIPAGLLDFLIIVNFAMALLLLLLTFYMAKPVEFSTFPSLLLIATLFRLALNIAATRLVLGQADAGRVIAAVGSYVVAGNYVIGLIVFLILVVVQFVVVTSGAQRVAEVAARFTLDSMPGQQMSIDADLNMGFIDQAEAQRRRRQLEKEANFYGAMDGASKFVKGDAIAGIVILLIDIIGGFAVGVLQHGMNWDEALRTYTLLTVGDGIVTQVPALVIALGTGIIVTRSSSDERLSAEIIRQVTLFPKTLALVALSLLGFALLPGIPVLPAMATAGVAAAAAWVAMLARVEAPDTQKAPKRAGDDDPEEMLNALAVEPVEITVGQNLVGAFQGGNAEVVTRISGFRKQFANESGFVLPTVRIRDDKTLNPNAYAIAVYGSEIARGELLTDRLLAIHPGGERQRLDGIDTKDPTYGLPAIWIAEDLRTRARAAGYTVVDPVTVFITHLSETVRQNAALLLTRAETERLVNRVRGHSAGLVDELLPNVVTLSEVQKVLQNLLREKVSIRNLEAVLEVLVDAGRASKDADQLTELVRQRLAPSICRALTSAAGDLQVLTLDPAIEQSLAGSLKASGERQTLAVEPRFAEQVLSRTAAQVERMLKTNTVPVLLCAPELRRHIRKLTERVMPHLAVLSMSEVPSNVTLRAWGVVTV